MPWKVQGTKKGALPVALEKRPRGKVVTLVKNVTGDKKELLREIQRALGAGGNASANPDPQTIEIMGNHVTKVEAYLAAHRDSLTGVADATVRRALGLAPKEKQGKKGKIHTEAVDLMEYKRENWSCVSCHSVNVGDRKACVKCSTFRPKPRRRGENAVHPSLLVVPLAYANGPKVALPSCPIDWPYCSSRCPCRSKQKIADIPADTDNSDGLTFFVPAATASRATQLGFIGGLVAKQETPSHTHRTAVNSAFTPEAELDKALAKAGFLVLDPPSLRHRPKGGGQGGGQGG